MGGAAAPKKKGASLLGGQRYMKKRVVFKVCLSIIAHKDEKVKSFLRFLRFYRGGNVWYNGKNGRNSKKTKTNCF